MILAVLWPAGDKDFLYDRALAKFNASKKERLASGGLWLGDNILNNYANKLRVQNYTNLTRVVQARK